jgi:class 3 adenylate cyclase
MEVQTQFCTTPDGANLAYMTFGQGPPLVVANGCWLSASHDLEEGFGGPFYRSLAQNHTVTLYDRRGTGLSDRERTEFTVEADASDLTAIVNRLGVERFALLGNCALGGAAITYAARNPEKVSELILYATWADGRSMARDEIKSSFILQARSHWGLGSRTIAGLMVPESDGAMVDRVAVAMRESCDGETAASFLEMMYTANVTELLSEVTMPTLVLQRRNDRGVPFRAARDLCSSLPNARLTALKGHHHLISYSDYETVVDTVHAFLGTEVTPTSGTEEAPAADVYTILFTDVEGSTALTDRLGDAKARELLREHESITREALKEHGGSEVKTMGDGFMASFAAATKALECGIALQNAFAERNESADEPINVRIGLNAGEPISEDEDLFGTAVNMAARIASKAEGGEILASNVVRELVAGKGFLFNDRGETELRGFEDPVRVYEVRWSE